MSEKLVLLVEDNSDDEHLTVRALRRGGTPVRVEVARDGQEALDWLFGEGEHAEREPRRQPDLIMLDLRLPKRSGIEVLREVRARSETRFIPVVILTSSDEHVDRLHGYQSGANSFVRKPVDYDEFIEAARQLGLYWLVLNKGV